MHMTDLIEKKKQGQTLTQEELHFIVRGYTAGDIPDYQMSALLMAICFRGMTPEETAQLTMEMEHSGDVVDFSPLGEHPAGKHSTGGVGDQTSVVLCPMVAACGGKNAKMSGPGHGHTRRPNHNHQTYPPKTTANPPPTNPTPQPPPTTPPPSPPVPPAPRPGPRPPCPHAQQGARRDRLHDLRYDRAPGQNGGGGDARHSRRHPRPSAGIKIKRTPAFVIRRQAIFTQI